MAGEGWPSGERLRVLTLWTVADDVERRIRRHDAWSPQGMEEIQQSLYGVEVSDENEAANRSPERSCFGKINAVVDVDQLRLRDTQP
jgi:hypothetical protein